MLLTSYVELSRTTDVSHESMSLCLKVLRERLPSYVQNDIQIMSYEMCLGFNLSEEEYQTFVLEEELPEASIQSYDTLKEDYQNMFRAPYIFWPILYMTDNRMQWALAVIHLNQGSVENPDWKEGDCVTQKRIKLNIFNSIEGIAVLDPDQTDGDKRSTLIYNRILYMLTRAGMESGDDPKKEVWLPPMNSVQHQGELEYWSSGLRCFDLARQLMDRILDRYCEEPGSHPCSLWDPTRGWFNPDAVRADMIGIAAMEVNKRMAYTTKIAIEPVSNLKHGDKAVGTRLLRPDRSHVHMWQPGKYDKNGEAVMWETPGLTNELRTFVTETCVYGENPPEKRPERKEGRNSIREPTCEDTTGASKAPDLGNLPPYPGQDTNAQTPFSPEDSDDPNILSTKEESKDGAQEETPTGKKRTGDGNGSTGTNKRLKTENS